MELRRLTIRSLPPQMATFRRDSVTPALTEKPDLGTALGRLSSRLVAGP